VSEQSTANIPNTRQSIINLLRRGSKKARFITELRATLQRSKINADELERSLNELEGEGLVMVRDHYCADPHLAGVDLRIVALVGGDEEGDAQMSAIHEIDNAWNKWLGEYLANHRCT
jgi:hypothetical protein